MAFKNEKQKRDQIRLMERAVKLICKSTGYERDYGRNSYVAHLFEVTPQRFGNWLKGYVPIHPQFAKAVEEWTEGKVKREQLRPDLYE